jgi:hypothetical protein
VISTSLKSAYDDDFAAKDKNTFRYRMGKKVLTEDVNVYCKKNRINTSNLVRKLGQVVCWN